MTASDPIRDRGRPEPRRRPYLFLVVAVAIVMAPLVWWMLVDLREDEREALVMLAQVRAVQVAAAHERLLGDVRVLTTAFPLARAYELWRRQGDLEARDLLLDRLEALVDGTEFDALALVDGAGLTLWASEGGVLRDLPARMDSAWPRGAVPGTSADLGFVADAIGGVRVAYAAALPTLGDEPPPILVGQAKLARLLAAAPVVGRRHGSDVGFALLDPTGPGLVVAASSADPDEGGTGPVAVAVEPDDDALLARALADEAGGATITAVGPDGRLAVGASATVGDTAWRVVAYAPVRDLARVRWPNVAVVVLLATLLYAFGLVGLAWLEDRRRRETLAAVRRADADRDRARSLLAAIADASPDAIFAKDLEGRYLFVNRAAASFLGSDPEAVLGRDDRALFPPAQAEMAMAHDRRLVAERTVATTEEHLDTVRGPTVFLATKGPLLDAEGQVSGTFGVSRDVTERDAASRALAEQARALQRTLDEVERFNQTLVGRELAMIDLKRRVNALSRRLGEAPPFDVSAFPSTADGADA